MPHQTSQVFGCFAQNARNIFRIRIRALDHDYEFHCLPEPWTVEATAL
jgi:hypothetical protein